MGFDFLRFLTPEQRTRIQARQAAHDKDVAEVRAMSNQELCERAAYYLSQCEFPYRWLPGDPVYDGVVAHVILPELLRRIGCKQTVEEPQQWK